MLVLSQFNQLRSSWELKHFQVPASAGLIRWTQLKKDMVLGHIISAQMRCQMSGQVDKKYVNMQYTCNSPFLVSKNLFSPSDTACQNDLHSSQVSEPLLV